MFSIGIFLSAVFPTTLSWCAGGNTPYAEAQRFLDDHNKLRRTISAGNYVARGRRIPPARTPLPAMEERWDCGLEVSAQRVADTCVFQHSQNRDNTGENIYKMWGSESMRLEGTAQNATFSWENEFQQYGWNDVRLTESVFYSGVGHATQMAWAKSTRLGCGMQSCRGGTEVLIVCQYKDAGNYIDQNVYEPR